MRLIVVAAIVFMISATSFAESYAIRVRYNTNLRASYSLESAVLATAAAGTTVEVISEFNRWLQVNRDGGSYWMASWVAHERVEASANQADVDNCCFIDRQCETDAEWVEGYWAYQRNECPAIALPTQLNLAEPASSKPVTVDNCCGIDRVCSTETDWIAGYWAYQNQQCASPSRHRPVSPSRPPIEGSPAFVRWITSALDLLEARTPHWYNYVASHTNVIVEVPDEDGPLTCTARVATSIARVMVQTDCRAFDSRLPFIAGILYHEACHVYHHVNGISYPEGNLREEWECSTFKVLKDLDPSAGIRQMAWEEYVAWNSTRTFGH